MSGDHAITIRAKPADVWPWLAQVGWHRGGWYTYRWVDRLLFPQNTASAEQVLPQFQSLNVGDRIPDGPPELGCYFTVEELEAGHHFVLRSTTHLPPQLMNREGIEMSWTWAFVVEPEGDDCTRFHFRWRGEARPLLLHLVYQAGHARRLRDGPKYVPWPEAKGRDGSAPMAVKRGEVLMTKKNPSLGPVLDAVSLGSSRSRQSSSTGRAQ
jgi:hypothetical protein